MWTSVVTDVGESMACVKSVNSGSVADKDGALQPGKCCLVSSAGGCNWPGLL